MGIGLVFLVSALVMPSFSISMEGFSLSYIYIAVLDPADINPPWPITIPYELFENISQALLGYPVFAAALILYPFALTFGIASSIRNKLKLVAGIFGFSTGVIWIVGIEVFKSSMMQEAINKALVEGGRWMIVGESVLRSSQLTLGYGAYAVLLAGILFLGAFYVQNHSAEQH
jgi:hypothetical protein